MEKIQTIEGLPDWLTKYSEGHVQRDETADDDDEFRRAVRRNMHDSLRSLNQNFWSQTEGYPQGILDRAPVSQDRLVEVSTIAREALPMLPHELPERVAHWIKVRVEEFSRFKPGAGPETFTQYFHGSTNNFGVTISGRNLGPENGAEVIHSPFNSPELGVLTKRDLWDAVDSSLKRLGLLEGVKATLLPVPTNLLKSSAWALERYGYTGVHQQGITKTVMWPSFVDLLCQGLGPDILAA